MWPHPQHWDVETVGSDSLTALIEMGEINYHRLLRLAPDMPEVDWAEHIQHLPLSCENTNTPLPYIDLVNETLEYYVTNNLSLADYLMRGFLVAFAVMALPTFLTGMKPSEARIPA